MLCYRALFHRGSASVSSRSTASPAKIALAVSYNGYDPLRLPNSLMEALPYFDGRLVVDALRAIEREKHLRLDTGLIRKLVDYAILVPVPDPPVKRKRK